MTIESLIQAEKINVSVFLSTSLISQSKEDTSLLSSLLCANIYEEIFFNLEIRNV